MARCRDHEKEAQTFRPVLLRVLTVAAIACALRFFTPFHRAAFSAACAACVLLLLGTCWRRGYNALERGARAFAYCVGWVLSAVLLSLVYWLVFTPAALFRRLRGHDCLHRGWDQASDTYWQEHRVIGGDARFRRQW